MTARDFYYNGHCLSEYGFIIGHVQDGEIITENMPPLVFDTQPNALNQKRSLLNTHYDECITCQFQIVKDPFVYDDISITNEELSDMARWLNQRNYNQMYFISEDMQQFKNCNASFNIKKIEYAGKIIGLSLEMETDSPLYYGDTVILSWNVTDAKKTFILSDTNETIGDTNLDLSIKLNQGGDLTISNALFKEKTEIKNCLQGETIRLQSGLGLIDSDSEDHRKTLVNDFNFIFPKITNTFYSRNNEITFSVPCNVTISYNPLLY